MVDAIAETFPTEFQERFAAAGLDLNLGCHIQLVFSFSGRLDPARLGRAARLLVDAEPILGCWLDSGVSPPVWRRHADLDAVAWLETAGHADFESAVTRAVGAFERADGRNLIVRLLSLPGHDVLTVAVNHAAADGAGAIECAYLLAWFYSALAGDPEVRLAPNTASRDSFEWMGSFKFRHKLRTMRRDLQDIRRARIPALTAPLAASFEAWRGHKRGAPGFAAHRIGPERLAAIDAVAAAHGATRLGVLAAGMGRAFAGFSPGPRGAAFRLMLASNLRRFAPASRRPAIRNLSAVASMCFDPAPDGPFAATLAAAVKEVDRVSWGLSGATNPVAAALLRLIPAKKKRVLVTKMAGLQMTRQGAPAFSNVGRLNEARLGFDGVAPEQAMVVSGAFPMPLFLVIGVEYRRTLTLTLAFQTDTLATARAQGFLDDVVAQIPVEAAA